MIGDLNSIKAINPAREPQADGWFHFGCVRYEWLGWQ